MKKKLKMLFESGITDCNEISWRTGIAKSTVDRTVDKIQKDESISKKVQSCKQRHITANETRSLLWK